MTQQGRDPSIAVTAIGLGQLDDVGGQRRFVVSPSGGLAVLGPMLASAAQGGADTGAPQTNQIR
jgi:hypothetical protein